MRRLRPLVCLAVALATAPASAQSSTSPTSSWRAAISAALAFGYAEGKAAALANVRIPAAPTTRKAADAMLDDLDRRASDARDAFSHVQRYGVPFWSIAADVRIGDTFECQALIIVDMPMPGQLTASLPPSVKSQYRAVMWGLVEPLERQAHQFWERAASSKEESAFWRARARERLAGGPVPGC